MFTSTRDSVLQELSTEQINKGELLWLSLWTPRKITELQNILFIFFIKKYILVTIVNGGRHVQLGFEYIPDCTATPFKSSSTPVCFEICAFLDLLSVFNDRANEKELRMTLEREWSPHRLVCADCD